MKKRLILGRIAVAALVVAAFLYVTGARVVKDEVIWPETLGGLVSLKRDSLGPVQVERVYVSEIDFLEKALDILKKKDWSGSREEVLPLQGEDFEAADLARFGERERERQVGIDVPERLRGLYLDERAQVEMRQLISQKRREFLDYAAYRGVNERYRELIETVILPDKEGRIFYFPHGHYPEGSRTNVHVFEGALGGDYRPLQLEVYAGNVYKAALECHNSGVLGTKAEDDADLLKQELICREMGISYVVYHEMTHVLQQALDVANAPALDQKSLIPWLNSPRSTLLIDDRHYQIWGEETDPLTRKVNNLTIAKESQAEGLAVMMVGEVYGFSQQQKDQWWRAHFDGLEDSKLQLERVFEKSENWYPELNINVLVHGLRTVVEDDSGQIDQAIVFSSMLDRLEGLVASHYGYLHPMKPEETQALWAYFAE